MNYYICFELISNVNLHNIVFVSDLPSHLKNYGSATSPLFPYSYLFFILIIMSVRTSLYIPQLIFRCFKVNDYISF